MICDEYYWKLVTESTNSGFYSVVNCWFPKEKPKKIHLIIEQKVSMSDTLYVSFQRVYTVSQYLGCYMLFLNDLLDAWI